MLMTILSLISPKSMPDIINILEKETGVAQNWLEQNEMIANLDNSMLYCSEKPNKYQWRTH